MTTDISREEYASDVQDLRARMDRLEAKIDLMSIKQSEYASWKILAYAAGGLLLGLLPYVLHLAGAVK